MTTEHTAPAPSSPSTRPADEPERRSRGRNWLAFLRDIVVIVLVAVLVSFLVKSFIVRSFYIPSGSMQDTLQINDRVIVNELVPDVVALKRGDVVVFKDPGGWLTGTDVPNVTPTTPVGRAADWVLTQIGLGTGDSDDHLIKRVIGLPGDTVSCCNDLGQMSVNGVPITDFAKAGLPVASLVRFKLFTLDHRLVRGVLGHLSEADSARVTRAIGKLLG